jgi:hypothetical protein
MQLVETCQLALLAHRFCTALCIVARKHPGRVVIENTVSLLIYCGIGVPGPLKALGALIRLRFGGRRQGRTSTVSLYSGFRAAVAIADSHAERSHGDRTNPDSKQGR